MENHEQRERLSEWYDEHYFRIYPHHTRRIAQILRRLPIAASDRVCEFGCGLGHILFSLAPKIAYGLGIDFSAYAITDAKRRADAEGIRNLEFRAEDIEKLPEDITLEGAFTKVLMMDISEHLYDDTLLQFLKSARHVLVPGGRLYLHTPNAGYYLEIMKARNFILRQFPSHIAVRDAMAYDALLRRAGFRIAKVTLLPHYNRVLGALDRVLMRLPFLGRLFEARLLIEAATD